MGRADTATINFMRQNDVFADAFNFFLYQGYPVITLFISFSPEEWDGPRSLAEMVGIKDEAVLARMPDYRINLVSPAEIGKEEFGKFHSALGDGWNLSSIPATKRNWWSGFMRKSRN